MRVSMAPSREAFLSSLADRRLSVLFVHAELPRNEAQSRSLRMFRYIEIVAAAGHRVTVVGLAGFAQERSAEGLANLGVEVHPVDFRQLRARGAQIAGLGFDFPLLLGRGRFDVAYLSCEVAEHYLPTLRAFSPATWVIVDGHDARTHEGATCTQADLLVPVSEGDAPDSLNRVLAAALPGVFMTRSAPVSVEDARPMVRDYIEMFAEEDPVRLIVPAPAGGPDPSRIYAALARAIELAGYDAERVPDIAVAPCADVPPVPSCAIEIGAEANAPCARASVIVLAYGRRDFTERCLAALERDLGDRLGAEIELVLVDNGSSDSTPELFEEWRGRARIVSLPVNRNFAGGANAGAFAARGKVLVLVSNDIEVGPGAIDAMIDEAEQPGVGLVGARLCYPDGRIQHGGLVWRGTPGGVQPFHMFHYERGTQPMARATLEIGAVTGACVAARAEVFRLVGGFDEGYVNGWEDSDLSLRIRSTGATLRYRGDVEIVHHEGVTAGGRYDEHDNPERFFRRWGTMLTDDSAFWHGAFGARISPLIDLSTGAETPLGANVCVTGPLIELGPSGAEGRALLRSLRRAGLDVAARPRPAGWVTPQLDEERWRELAGAQLRDARPDAVVVSVGAPLPAGYAWPGAAHPGRAVQIVRVDETVACRPGDAVAWAPCPAVLDRLRAQGWPPSAIELVAPVAIEAPPGGGGGGILLLAPTHDRALTAALLRELRRFGHRPVRVLPSVRTPDLPRAVRDALPQAELLAACTDERVVAALAADSDLVVAVDPYDPFDRLALTAAAAGAAVAVRASGPAAWVLGEHATVVDPTAPRFLTQALADDRGAAVLRQRRSKTVLEACGTEPSTRVLSALLGQAQVAA
jgi:GT2 family glycosyltransferase